MSELTPLDLLVNGKPIDVHDLIDQDDVNIDFKAVTKESIDALEAEDIEKHLELRARIFNTGRFQWAQYFFEAVRNFRANQK